MSELSDKIRSVVHAVQKRSADAQVEAERKQDEHHAAVVDFENLKNTVIRPVLVNTSELLAKNRVASQVEERKSVTYKDDHIRLTLEPPERAVYPGASVLLFARSPREGVDVNCYYRGSDNVTHSNLHTLHLKSDEVTTERVEQILTQVIGRMIEPTPGVGELRGMADRDSGGETERLFSPTATQVADGPKSGG
jgi:hypothetical protein